MVPSTLVWEAFNQAPAFIAVLSGPDHVFEYVNQAYRRLIGFRDVVGHPVREAVPEVDGQGFFELLDGVLATGDPFVGENLPIRFQHTPGGEVAERRLDFVYQPLRTDDGAVSGILVHGVEVTDLSELNAALESRVSERTQEVRALALMLTLAEQAERERIAQVLHDDLQQQLFGLSMLVSALRRAGPGLQDEVEVFVDRASTILGDAAQTARSLSTELAPAVLKADRLRDLLEWIAVRKKQKYGLDITVEVQGDPDVADPELRVLLYRGLCEVLLNVAKHAGVLHVRLVAWEDGRLAVVRVEDDGAGFDAERMRLDGTGGLGLSSVRERFALVGGRFEAESAPGHGTRVTLAVPMGKAGRE